MCPQNLILSSPLFIPNHILLSRAWFGIIPSSAQIVGSVIEGKIFLRVGSAHQETCGGYNDGDEGLMARRKVPKLAQNIFNNQQRLVVAMGGHGGGGVARMGGD